MAPKIVQKKRKATSTESKPAAIKKARISKDETKDSAATKPKLTSKIEKALAVTKEDGFEAFEDDASEDDQTAALLKGFESSDESGNEDEEEEADSAPLDISTLPDPAAALESGKSTKALSKAAPYDRSTLPTVLYLSRVPHGFYEPQMKSYFSQFGDIRRLRLARNRRTGASKHYAFIEFNQPEVAKIVQQTMNNYLMFKHILKVRLVEKNQVHPDLWKGAGKRFKAVPWNRIDRSRVSGTDRAGWTKRVRKEEARRLEKQEKLAALGYTFNAPELMDVDSVPVQVKEVVVEAPLAAEAQPAPEAEVKLLEEAPKGETVLEKLTKKSKKADAVKPEPIKVVKITTKAKKSKKAEA